MQDQSVYLLKINHDKLKRLRAIRDIISKDEYDKVESDCRTNENDIRIAEHRIEELLVSKKRIRKEIAFLYEDERNRLLAELAEKKKNHLYLQANIEKTAYLNSKQNIIAPVHGYINKMLIHTIGGVVTPAEKVISLVPADSPLIIKALVQNKDIGFVSTGMKAGIKVDTFNFQKYGVIDGTVKTIGRDSLEDKALGLVYESLIEPKKTTLMVEGVETPVSTGMSVTVEIKVGKRRIIEFFVYPLIKYLDEGISVR
jgi:hemolysin D